MPAALLERTRHGFELAWLSGSVVRAARLVIGIQSLRVLLFRLRIRFDGLLELLDVVGERDQVVVRCGLDFGELGLRAAPVANRPEEEKCHDSGDQQADHGASSSARLAATPTTTGAAAASLRGHTVDEVDERGGHALAAMGGERLGGQASCGTLRQDITAGAEVPPDHCGVGPLASERVMDGLEHAVRTAARFLLGRGRENRDVDGPGAGTVDLPAQPVLVCRRDRKLGRRVDIDRIRIQRSDRPVDDRSGLRRGHEDERRRRRGREQEQALHEVSRTRARFRAP